MKLKKIHQGFHGHENRYQLGETFFRISRNTSFSVYDESIGINAGQAVFRMYGRIDFNYGMRQFKKWLETSKYTTIQDTKDETIEDLRDGTLHRSIDNSDLPMQDA